MEKKVVYEVRFSKPVMVIATVATIGLLAIGAKPLIEAKPAFADGEIHKIAVCDPKSGRCVRVNGNNRFAILG